jgi:hypothetical protein
MCFAPSAPAWHMTRPRLARLQRIAKDLAGAARGRRDAHDTQRPDVPASDELARRLDETRERLRRDIPPPDE